MNSKYICIYGTGGFAREILCLLSDLKRKSMVLAFIEPDEIWEKYWKDTKIMNIPVLPESDFNPKKSSMVIGIGNSKIREKVVNALPIETNYETLIHPSAIISSWTEIGEGTIICAGTVVTCQIKIGKHAQLNLNSTVGHDCNIGDFFTIAPGVNISGICNIGNHVYFGTGAGTRQGVSITNDVTIGMGGMVVKDITESGTYVGIPTKKLSK